MNSANDTKIQQEKFYLPFHSELYKSIARFYKSIIMWHGFSRKPRRINFEIFWVSKKLGVVVIQNLNLERTKEQGIVRDSERDLAQVLHCEFCKTSNNTFFREHLRATASEGTVREQSHEMR